MILISRIQKEFNVKFQLVSFFRRPTIRALGQNIRVAILKGISEDCNIRLSRALRRRNIINLSSSQKRLYFLMSLTKLHWHINMSDISKLEGKLDRNKLSEAFSQLVIRHESLRTCFDRVKDEPVQRILQSVKLELELFNQLNLNQIP